MIVHFVDVGGNDDHHWLKLLFIWQFLFWNGGPYSEISHIWRV